ncbi:MAG: RebB family R body protein [Bacteroidota bacterium]
MSQETIKQITDSIAQANLEVIAIAPAFALGMTYQSMAHSAGLMFEQNVQAQGLQSIIAQATTVQGVTQIYSTNTVADAMNITETLQALQNS